MVMNTVMSMVVNLKCNYLSQTKTCGQKWWEISMGVIMHRKWVIWNGCSIPDYPCRVLWNKNLCHFTPAEQFGMQGILACYTGNKLLQNVSVMGITEKVVSFVKFQSQFLQNLVQLFKSVLIVLN